jgi:hypothetical protein
LARIGYPEELNVLISGDNHLDLNTGSGQDNTGLDNITDLPSRD